MNQCEKIVKKKLVNPGKVSDDKKAAYLEKLRISRQQKKLLL
jgi:hypothetical protein